MLANHFPLEKFQEREQGCGCWIYGIADWDGTLRPTFKRKYKSLVESLASLSGCLLENSFVRGR